MTTISKIICVGCGVPYIGKVLSTGDVFTCPHCNQPNILKAIHNHNKYENNNNKTKYPICYFSPWDATKSIFSGKYNGISVQVLHLEKRMYRVAENGKEWIECSGKPELTFEVRWQLNFLGNREKGIMNDNEFTLTYTIPNFNGEYKKVLNELLRYAKKKINSIARLKWPLYRLPLDGIGKFSTDSMKDNNNE